MPFFEPISLFREGKGDCQSLGWASTPPCHLSISRIARADFLRSSIWGLQLNWSSLRFEDLRVPLPFCLDTAGTRCVSLFISGWWIYQTALYSPVVDWWEAPAQPQSSAALSMVWLAAGGTLLPAAAQGFQQVPDLGTSSQGWTRTFWM